MRAKTACCCCVCAFDDFEDWCGTRLMCGQCCCDASVQLFCFQCCEESVRACCQCSGFATFCDTSDPEKGCAEMVCCGNGCEGKSLCCIIGGGHCNMQCPPYTVCANLLQCFFIHLRCAIPCNDDMPFSIYCCGFPIVE
eukprot:UN26638